MPEPPHPPPPPPPPHHDLRTIRHLVRLMQAYDLTAIDLGEGPHKIRLRRRGAEVAPSTPAAAPLAAPSSPVHAAAPPAASPSPTPAPPKGLTIDSPMVGTFYSSSAPDAPPFVNVGSVIQKDTIVCVIEAMKVFTDIPAGVAGTIAEILVKNGQPVEFGQPLFRVSQD
jgi:acetyl-CoA carboxylase biotin carboxyl carrier protein